MTPLHPYPAMRDSGDAWLGEVPKRWDVVALRRLADGFTNGTSVEQISLGTTECPVSRIETISKGIINYAKVGYLKPLSFDNRYWLVRKDILLSHINSFAMVGNCAMYDGSKPLVHGMNLLRIRPREDLDAAFLFSFLKSVGFRDQIRSLCKPSINQVSVTTGAIKAIRAPLPPLDEQRAIVRYLDYMDRRIRRYTRAKQKLIALLEEQKQAIIHRAVTRGLDPAVPLKPSGIEWLGDVPAHWEVKRFKYVARVTSGLVDPRTPEHRDKVLIAPNHIRSGSGLVTHEETAEEQGADSGKYEVRAGQLVYSKIRPKLRKAAIARADCLCSADMYPLTVREDLIKPEFLLLLMLSDPFTRFAVDCSLRVAMPKVNREALAEGAIWYPSLAEQNRILASIRSESEPIEHTAAAAQREIDLLREYRTRLIADVVTGKLDVREAAASLPDEADEPEEYEAFEEAMDEEDEGDAPEDGGDEAA